MEFKPRGPLATIIELAEHLQVSVATVYRWNSQGTGPAYAKIGRHVRYRWADVDRWVEQRKSIQ